MAQAVTLLIMCCVASSSGCRDDENHGGSAIPFRLQFNTGDTFRYDVWAIDPYGYVVNDTLPHSVWRVAATGQQVYGRSDVTVVFDSLFATTPSDYRMDTLYFAFSPAGDIYQYGFLAELMRRRGITIPKQWDCIAAFSTMPATPWSVGPADSMASVYATGQIVQTPKLFLVVVDSVRDVYPAYQVQITGPDLQVTYWVADAPSSFPLYQEESGLASNGRVKELLEAHLGSR